MRLVFSRIIIAACLSGLAHAEVTRIEITGRSPFVGGRTFGLAGACERIEGRFFPETDPQNAANERISDLQLAPRNARGKVESRTDFFLLNPVDATSLRARA
jgi:hypothetical protein